MQSTSKLYSLSFLDIRTYLFATIFIVGNIVFPQLAHQIPQGGLILLPIYFFTLIASYKYGIKVGLLTSVLTPLINHIVFGMPPAHMLSIIVIKSSLLAIGAAYAAHYFKRVSIVAVLLAVLFYQVVGTVIEWAMLRDFWIAVSDFRLGFPGMLVQVLFGFAILKLIEKW